MMGAGRPAVNRGNDRHPQRPRLLDRAVPRLGLLTLIGRVRQQFVGQRGAANLVVQDVVGAQALGFSQRDDLGQIAGLQPVEFVLDVGERAANPLVGESQDGAQLVRGSV